MILLFSSMRKNFLPQPHLPQFHQELLITPIPLHRIARPAKQLQILDMVRSSPTDRNDVINCQIAVGKGYTATLANPFKLAEPSMLLRSVVGDLTDISTYMNVGSVGCGQLGKFALVALPD